MRLLVLEGVGVMSYLQIRRGNKVRIAGHSFGLTLNFRESLSFKIIIIVVQQQGAGRAGREEPEHLGIFRGGQR